MQSDKYYICYECTNVLSLVDTYIKLINTNVHMYMFENICMFLFDLIYHEEFDIRAFKLPFSIIHT